ncbi:aldo/keto reductase [Clostridiisalibacter paucivorans]|uniref:aldo/keto reductase n=1 Tax=Clostridiisalibacter paucivorans TaxID=408753 RepID=UPI00047ECECF|nr:aldo/keto reductase [Clostridiisalibacter paucivorans]
MQYRKFGNLGFEVSALGFGCMRFPTIDDDNGKIDEKRAIDMIRYAIDNGVNYIDTAYPYHQGNSEPLVGRALKDGYREKVKLATKLPSWLIKTEEDFDRLLNEQLERLQSKHIDLYLVHTLNKNFWKNLTELNLLKFLDKAKADGRIKHVGFSFHDSIDLFKEIVDAYDWEFCQIQLNYVDERYQAGIEGLKYASSKGLPVVIMEPIKGGKLAREPKGELKKIFDNAPVHRTPAEWALKWLWNKPEVTVVLSGMSTEEQLKENLQIADRSLVNTLNKKEIEFIDSIKKFYKDNVKVDCTGCKYCIPCPQKIAIPDIFELYNDGYMYDLLDKSKKSYESVIDKNRDASQCIECGKCEASCPQNLPIITDLKRAHRDLI